MDGERIEKLSQQDKLSEFCMDAGFLNIVEIGQRLRQNHKEENLPALHQEQFLLGREIGLMLNQENVLSPIMKCRRK